MKAKTGDTGSTLPSSVRAAAVSVSEGDANGNANAGRSCAFVAADCDSMNHNGEQQAQRAPIAQQKQKAPRLPKLGRHSSGAARACFGGKMEYFGPFGEPETLARYAERCRQWLAGGSQPTTRAPHASQAMLNVADLFAQYRAWLDATGRYVKAGQPTSQRNLVDDVLDAFERFAATTRVATLREATIIRWRDELEGNRRLTRRGINRKLTLLRQCFKWARTRGLLSREAWAELAAVELLQRGQCGDRREHARPRRAVSLEDVEKTAAACTCRHVAAMLRVQARTGMRPGEVCAMRWSDIDRTPVVVDGLPFWTYRVAAPKTEHHGRTTTYPLGPDVQKILAEFPGVGAAHVFSPAASMSERGRAHKNAPAFREGWRTRTYRQAVERAAKAAGVPHYSPHEIRHGAVTRAAEQHGVMAAQAMANHSSATTTARYLHTRDDAAYRVAAANERRSG